MATFLALGHLNVGENERSPTLPVDLSVLHVVSCCQNVNKFVEWRKSKLFPNFVHCNC